VLSEDEMGAAELIHLDFALRFGAENTALLVT